MKLSPHFQHEGTWCLVQNTKHQNKKKLIFPNKICNNPPKKSSFKENKIYQKTQIIKQVKVRQHQIVDSGLIACGLKSTLSEFHRHLRDVME